MSVSEDPSVADEWEPSSRTSLALGAYIVVIFAAVTWLLFCLWPEAESSKGAPDAGAELRQMAMLAVMGALGANIFTMSSYCLHLARRDFDRSYVSWYLLRPAIGAGMAMIVYMNDYDDEYPTQDQWCDLLIQEADVSPKSFQCPLDPEGSFSYAINENLYKLEPSEVSPQMVMLFEADLGRNGVGGPEDLVIRHDELNNHGYNVVFADGHVDFITEDRIGELQWTVE